MDQFGNLYSVNCGDILTANNSILGFYNITQKQHTYVGMQVAAVARINLIHISCIKKVEYFD